MPIYLVETIAQYHMVYAVEAPDAHTAKQAVVDGAVESELAQTYLGETVLKVVESTTQEILAEFDSHNPMCRDWSDQQKLQVLHRMDDDGSALT